MNIPRRHLLKTGTLAVLGSRVPPAGAASAGSPFPVRHRRLRVAGLEIFYREAGPPGAPVVLLLHGFPSSSFMFRELIPLLSDRYRVIAPDYPGFGASAFPSRSRFRYSFAELARVIDAFTAALRLERYAMYVQDYGAPVGFRLALAHPERVSALVIQNGNAYVEGLSAAWEPLRAYWREPTRARREKLGEWLTETGTRQQYVAGVPEALLERFSPDTWTLDWARLGRSGNREVQLDLFADYRTNVELYPEFHAYFRSWRPPALIVWGKYDVFFTLEGARAFSRDLPGVEINLYETGHFALETHAREIGERIREFLGRKLAASP